MTELSGLVALVTGGAAGIGRATASAFADAGARVVTLDSTPVSGSNGIGAVTADVRDAGSLETAVSAVIGQFGRLDILVNNAGVGATGTIEDGGIDEWMDVFDVNVLGIVRTTRAALPHLRRSPSPAIVNVSSVVAVTGLPDRACYSASKGAVVALTLATAADLLDDGIRVNCVLPGTVDTEWVQRLLAERHDPAAARRSLEERQPLGRLATPEEIAHALLYLASPKASFVTGTALTIDGGISGLRIPALARVSSTAGVS